MKQFLTVTIEEKQEVTITPTMLINAALTGRDQEKVRQYIRSLEKQGVKAADSSPSFFKKAPYLVDADEKMAVLDEQNSAEAEFVILIWNDEIYIGCGIDVFDKEVQGIGAEKAKHLYPNHMSRKMWKYSEHKEHWDQIILRSWIGKERKILYQEERLSFFMKPEEIIRELEKKFGTSLQSGTIIFGGTIPYRIDGLPYIKDFEAELEDRYSQKRITCKMNQILL